VCDVGSVDRQRAIEFRQRACDIARRQLEIT
jgi:hypothetical protein